MTSILCGLAAACCWATVNVIATRIARSPDPRQLAFWFNAFGCALCAPIGLVLLPRTNVSPHSLVLLAIAGVATAAAIRLFTVALRRGRLGVVGPLMSLEGAVAATLALALAGGASGAVLAGIGISTLGAVAIAFGAARRGHLAGASHALCAASCAGLVLWALSRQSVAPLPALMIARAFGALALAPTVARWRLPQSWRWLLPIAALDIAGNAMFMLGSRAGSLPATAVLAAQFGTLTALGGIWRWKESLTPPQIFGLLILAAGVSAVAAGS